MQLTKEQKDKTDQNIYGKWLFEDNKFNITILITEEKVSLKNDLTLETFNSVCDWVNDYLIFTGASSKYYIKYADEVAMIFGEFTFSRNFITKWETKLQRIHN